VSTIFTKTLLVCLLFISTSSIITIAAQGGTSYSISDASISTTINILFDKEAILELAAEDALVYYSEEDESFVKVMEEGAQLLDDGNQILVPNKSEVNYSRLEVINAESNKMMFTTAMYNTDNTVDLSSFPPGNYMIILTNDAGNISVEKFSLSK